VPVQVLASPVVSHGGAWIGVPGDSHVAKVHTGIQHGGDEGVQEHARVHPGDRDAGVFGEPVEPAGGARW
jgi:hypothetical protein